MQPSQLSSGDVIADRRADYARMLDEGGEPDAAAELMEQALELVPAWAAGWYRLATYQEKVGKTDAAVEAYRRTLELDPEDVFGSSLKLALLGDTETPAQPPSRYVERLFDDYADRFETSLVEKLDYSVPQKLAALVASTGRHYRRAVDLGCGTGLLGPEIRAQVTELEGFDLSQNMLAKAAEKHIYDHLAQADLSLASEASGLFTDGARHRADLVTAADVLMYLGNLESVFAILDDLAIAGADFVFFGRGWRRRRWLQPGAVTALCPLPILCRRAGSGARSRNPRHRQNHHSQRWRQTGFRHSVPYAQDRLNAYFLRF